MARPPLQDIIRPERRSIRDIVIDRAGRKMPSREASKSQPPQPHSPPQSDLGEPPVGRRIFRNVWIWIIAALAIVLLLFVVASLVFAGATVTVTPRTAIVSINGSFTAQKDAAFGELPFEVMTFSQEAEKTIPTTGEKIVQTKASGRIVIYNNYSTASQKLIANTRFETPDGLIFRIRDAVTVPGQKKEDGKTVPGSLEVTVYAAEAGEKYNITQSDFTIPGFKGTPQYEGFYARSKTAMTGGFSGVMKTAKPEDEAAARTELEIALREQLMSQAGAEIPEGFVMFSDGSFTSFETIPDTSQNASQKSVVMTVRGTFWGIIFEETSFARHIAENALGEYDGSEVVLDSAHVLQFSIRDKDRPSPDDFESFTFELSGPPYLVWTFDEVRLKDDLDGKEKRLAPTVFSAYLGIERADVVVRPFWRGQLPEDPADIRVKTIIPNTPTE